MRKRKAADEIAHEKARRGTRQQQARKPQAPPRSFVRGAAVSSTHRSMAPSTQIIVRNAAPDTSQSSVSLTLWREPRGRANLVYPHFNHSYQQRLEELRGRRRAPHRRASIARSHAELRPKQPSSGSNLSTSAFRGAPSGVCARGCRGCARCRIAELVEKASQRAQQAGWICDEHSKERATQATPPHGPAPAFQKALERAAHATPLRPAPPPPTPASRAPASNAVVHDRAEHGRAAVATTKPRAARKLEASFEMEALTAVTLYPGRATSGSVGPRGALSSSASAPSLCTNTIQPPWHPSTAPRTTPLAPAPLAPALHREAPSLMHHRPAPTCPAPQVRTQRGARHSALRQAQQPQGVIKVVMLMVDGVPRRSAPHESKTKTF